MRTRKRFGQHILEPPWADKLVAAIDPQPGDRFLEIGPGPGALTLRLASRVAHLTAVEIDRDMASLLASRLPEDVDLVVGDFLQFDLTPLLERGALRVAGNLPYNLSSPILFRLIDASRAHGGLRDATIMVQREVAARMAARVGTGDYGVLAISVQLYAEVDRLLTLPPGAFRPPPRVHSAVVRLTFRPPTVVLADPALFDTMVRSIFTQRRKTVANSLRAFATGRGIDPQQALAAARIAPARRAETLHLTELARLAAQFAGGEPKEQAERRAPPDIPDIN